MLLRPLLPARNPCFHFYELILWLCSDQLSCIARAVVSSVGGYDQAMLPQPVGQFSNINKILNALSVGALSGLARVFDCRG
jgi:hypothetical protein